jgi:flavin-binding protein dodecin
VILIGFCQIILFFEIFIIFTSLTKAELFTTAANITYRSSKGSGPSDLLIFFNVPKNLMTHIAKVVEIIGSSEKGWSEAAKAALDEARKTIHGITGLEVNDITAKVDPITGKISEYRVGVKIAFGVEHP